MKLIAASCAVVSRSRLAGLTYLAGARWVGMLKALLQLFGTPFGQYSITQAVRLAF